MNRFRFSGFIIATMLAGSISACDVFGHPVRDAQWYRANKVALASKLDSCKTDPEGALIDAECASASQAFSVWHASQAFLENRNALSAKLAECKANPEMADTDIECIAANDAFARWYTAHQKAAPGKRQ